MTSHPPRSETVLFCCESYYLLRDTGIYRRGYTTHNTHIFVPNYPILHLLLPYGDTALIYVVQLVFTHDHWYDKEQPSHC